MLHLCSKVETKCCLERKYTLGKHEYVTIYRTKLFLRLKFADLVDSTHSRLPKSRIYIFDYNDNDTIF